jgi:rhamnulokinase
VASELTIASTSQLFDPRRRTWDRSLIERCGIPDHLFGEIVDPGTMLGEVRPEIGLPGAKVIAPASHDTASAVAAVPAEGEDWAYISSGTWALAGVESPSPVITDETLSLNLTNEAGVNGTTRLLKNITGLWILQECRRAWGSPEYEDLYAEAEAASCDARINPDDSRFALVNEDMPGEVKRFCTASGGPVPQTRGEVVRCILESLAGRSAQVIDQLESVTGTRIRTIHIVGGGSQIRLLNQLIANASGRRVVAGPTDATLTGNLLIQAQGFGRIAPGQLREVVRGSQEFMTFEPR